MKKIIFAAIILSIAVACKQQEMTTRQPTKTLVKPKFKDIQTSKVSSDGKQNVIMQSLCPDCQTQQPTNCGSLGDCLKKLVDHGPYTVKWGQCVDSYSNGIVYPTQSTSTLTFCYDDDCDSLIALLSPLALPCLSGDLCIRFGFKKCNDQNGVYEFIGGINALDSDGETWHVSMSTAGDPPLSISAFNILDPRLTCSCNATIEM